MIFSDVVQVTSNTGHIELFRCSSITTRLIRLSVLEHILQIHFLGPLYFARLFKILQPEQNL